jgi:hypothetical protein
MIRFRTIGFARTFHEKQFDGGAQRLAVSIGRAYAGVAWVRRGQRRKEVRYG